MMVIIQGTGTNYWLQANKASAYIIFAYRMWLWKHSWEVKT